MLRKCQWSKSKQNQHMQQVHREMSVFRISLQHQPRLVLLNKSEAQRRHTVNECVLKTFILRLPVLKLSLSVLSANSLYSN